MKWMTKTSIIAAVAFAVVIGLTALVPGRAESTEEVSKAKFADIQSISAAGEENSTELVIRLSSPVTYTSYKTTAPLRFVIDFSQTTQGAIVTPVLINKGNFKNVTVSRYDTDAGVLTRMGIELLSDGEPVISVSPLNPGELRVSFPAADKTSSTAVEKTDAPKPVETKTAASSPVLPIEQPTSAPAVGIRTLTSISTDKNSISLNMDGAVADYKTFRLNKPERYVVDLIDVKSGLDSKLIPINVAGVTSARIGLHPDKTRVVFDAVNGDFPETSATKTDSAVVLTIGTKPSTEEPEAKLPSTHTEASSAKALAPVPVPVAPVHVPVAPVPVPVPPKGKSPSLVLGNDVSTSPPAITSAKVVKSTGPASVEMIDFQVVEGISRVSVKINGNAVVDPPVKSSGFVTLTVKNTSIKKSLQRSLETRSFISPVLRITPIVVKNKKGSDTKIKIALRVNAQFEFRQEGDMLFVDFKNPDGLTADRLAAETTDRKPMASGSKAKASASGDTDISAELTQPQSTDSTGKTIGSSRGYTGRKVTLEFADADVRKIFQLLAEVSGKNFVLGDDVTGNISLKLVNVPWDQALDIILDTKDLDSRETGNVLTIKKKGKFGTQEFADAEAKKIAEKNLPLQSAKVFSVNYSKLSDVAGQFEKLSSGEKGSKIRIDATVTPDERTNKIIVVDTLDRLAQMQKLLSEVDLPERQVMIEARIVEAGSTFTRSLGVNWGMHYRDGSASLMGINQMDTSFGGLASAAPTTGASGTPGGSMGISFGTLASNISLDLRLNAAASAGLVRIVSTPKVATLNNKTAKIEQGDDIPFQNTDKNGNPITEFKKATLSLEVTPHINANGTIMLKINAKNDSPGRQFGNNVAIATKAALTEMMLRDGETTVIGGIFVDRETSSDDGVPYLKDIPFLGKLFKSDQLSKGKTELLIFITPRILSTI